MNIQALLAIFVPDGSANLPSYTDKPFSMWASWLFLLLQMASVSFSCVKSTAASHPSFYKCFGIQGFVYMLNAVMINGQLIRTTAQRIRKLCRLRPKLAIILGSGFHHVINEFELDAEIPYNRLKSFPPVGVSGHAGKLLIGRMGSTPVMILSGRAHFYEGHAMEQVTAAVRTLAAYGITDLLLTNAAGGVNRGFRPGDFMVLTDHINLMGVNPLRGKSTVGLPRFVDMTTAYDSDLSSLLQKAGQACGVKLRSGVYLAVSGPTYETPAEIRAFARLGADAVGMSTVPETIVARQCGLRVAAVSCITNLAAGMGKTNLSHSEVLETADRVKNVAAQLLKKFTILYGRDQ